MNRPRTVFVLLLAGLLSAAGGAFAQVGGVLIDAEGVVNSQSFTMSKATIKSLQEEASALPGGLNEPVNSRYVSLRSVLSNEPDRMADSLAGLTRIEVVVADPEAKDIYIGGPAEPYAAGPSGRVLGAATGRAVIPRTHLVAALRHVAAGRSAYGCSIDPQPERLANLREYLRRNSSPASAERIRGRYTEMARVLGPQEISVFGVDERSRLGLAAVEADLVMKEIALGKRKSGVREVGSHLALIRPNGNNLQRWWFAPKYEAIEASADRRTFRLLGPRLKLLAQDEIAGPDGVRTDAPVTRESTAEFAVRFSDHMDELATVQPTIATLQNVTDLLIVAELIRSEDLASVGFDPLAAAAALPPPEPLPAAPRTVASAATTWRAGGLVLGLVGGVTVDTRVTLRDVPRREGASETVPPFEGWYANGPAAAVGAE